MTNPNQVLNEYAEFLGIPRRESTGSPLWDGTALELLDKAEDTAHEIAHWILATPEARSLPNYGWNWDWKYRARLDTGTYSLDNGGPMENLTCMLQFAMMVRVNDLTIKEVWERYGYTWKGRIDQNPVDRCHVVNARREVQPHVRDFALWLNER